MDWIDEVENIVFNTIGIGLLDLPDEAYRMNHDNNWSAEEMANYVIHEYEKTVQFMVC
jgi:hypothetical protein